MKVLQVINTLDTGGAEKLLFETIPLYVEKKIEMDLLIIKGGDSLWLKQLQDMKCCTIHSLNSVSLYNPLNIFKIITYLKNYDLIHVHLFPLQYWVVLAKIISFSNVKLLYTEHSTYNRRRKFSFFKCLDKFFYNQYDKIICISSGVKNELMNVFNLPFNNLIIIENGIDISKFENADKLKKSSFHEQIFENDRLLAQVSKFRPEKDQNTVIKSMMHLPNNFKLLLVGDGQLKKESQLLVNELDLSDRVFFLGARNDIERILKTVDLSILSSHWEGFGLVAVEGMASGKPVIVSDVMGLSEVVEGAGLLFEKGNELELAAIIKSLLLTENKDYFDEIANKCRIRARQFDINEMVNKSINLYNDLLES